MRKVSRTTPIVALLAALALGMGQLALAGGPDENVVAPGMRASGPRVDVTSNVYLKSGKKAIFDPIGSDSYHTIGDPKPWDGAPCQIDKRGFSGAMNSGIDVDGDGVVGGLPDMSDAFDGGLFLEVNGQLFNATTGTVKGQRLTVKNSVAGLTVVRVLQALKAAPALREYTSFTNVSTTSKAVTVTFDTAVGADNAEDTRDSSSGNDKFTATDRWFVESDSAGTPSDPVITFVLSGVGAPGVSKVIWAPEDDSSARCDGAVVYNYHLTVPARSTVALLTFTEFNTTNALGSTGATKYNKAGLSRALLKGLSLTQRDRVENWNL